LIKARSLIENSLVCEAILPWTQYGDPELRKRTLPRYRESGFDLVSLSLSSDKEGPSDLLHAIARVRREIDDDEHLTLVSTADDIIAARDSGKLAISLNLQGTNSLDGDLGLVEVWHQLGIRQMLLVYNHKNRVGDGCHGLTDSGLSSFGIELVQEMNRVGMQVDCSHTGYRTSMEAIEASTAPVIFSHSNPKALNGHDRNIRDDQALACAASGGWIGLVGVDIFMPDSTQSSEHFFRQIDYWCELVGPSHVGLGTDHVYDAGDMQRYMRSVKSPESGNYENMCSFFQPEQIVEVVDLMLNAGYPENDISGILGGNYLRVAGEVWMPK
jgi:membrane dipeptidase